MDWCLDIASRMPRINYYATKIRFYRHQGEEFVLNNVKYDNPLQFQKVKLSRSQVDIIQPWRQEVENRGQSVLVYS